MWIIPPVNQIILKLENIYPALICSWGILLNIQPALIPEYPDLPLFSFIPVSRNLFIVTATPCYHGVIVMINNLFNNRTQVALEFALDAAASRAHLIAHNIANADTPGHKALRLRFEDYLDRELNRGRGQDTSLRRTDPRHIPGSIYRGLQGTPTDYGLIYTDDATTQRLDNNNVDIDHEMAEQAKNAIQYSILTELVSRRLAGLRTAISEGRR